MNKENESLMFQLDRLMRVLRRQRHNKMPRRGSRRLLSVICRHDGITTKELSEKLDIRVSSLNERLSRLIELGYIQREKNPLDLRTYILSITDKGKGQLEILTKQQREFSKQLDTILTQSEQDELIKLINKLANGIEDKHCQ